MEYEDKLTEKMKRVWGEKKHQLILLARTLDGYSPAKKISSGYAYVEGESHTSIKSINMINIADEITIHLQDGRLKARVTEVEKNE